MVNTNILVLFTIETLQYYLTIVKVFLMTKISYILIQYVFTSYFLFTTHFLLCPGGRDTWVITSHNTVLKLRI